MFQYSVIKQLGVRLVLSPSPRDDKSSVELGLNSYTFPKHPKSRVICERHINTGHRDAVIDVNHQEKNNFGNIRKRVRIYIRKIL